MTREEIVRSYRQAKKPERQITILADLNHATPQEIQQLLREEGAIPEAPPKAGEPPSAIRPLVSPEPALTNQGLERACRLMELAERGASAEKIAEEFGVSYGQALTWVARLCVLCEKYIAEEGGAPG